MTTEITREQFTEALRAAVAERGSDYRYPIEHEAYQFKRDGFNPDYNVPGCRYRNAETGEPACLIGVALSKIDPEFEAEEGVVASGVINKILGRLGSFSGENWILAANDAQGVQDDGGTWGQALARYEATLGIPHAELAAV